MTEQSANTQDSARYGWQTPPQAADALSVGTVDIRVNKRMCPECGVHVASGAESCPDCGENLVHSPKPIRCMHCDTTASSELVVCPWCGRELRAAPPKLMTVGVPALAALLLVALLVTQWGHISRPLTWARTNLVRGVVLVEDISAHLEPEMVIVMTPIVPDSTTLYAVGDASPRELIADGQAANDAQAVAMAGEQSVTADMAPATAPEEVLAASVVQELSFGVGGPKPDDEAHQEDAGPDDAAAANIFPLAEATEVPTATSVPPTPTATSTSQPTVALPTATQVPTEAPAARSAGLAATLATDEPTPTPSPTWTLVATQASSADESSVQVAAAAVNETSLPTPTVTPTHATTPLPTPTATPLVYQVRSGDTLVSIAANYDVDVDELMAANDISERDVYVIQPGQMLFVPVATPEPVVSVAVAVTDTRVEAPVLLMPTADARVGCTTGGALIWQRVPFVKDSDKYVLHLGFVSGHDDDGQERITWILAQSNPVTVAEWQLDTSLCELAPDEFDHQWRWWVEVVESADGGTVAVSPPSEVRGFTWQ